MSKLRMVAAGLFALALLAGCEQMGQKTGQVLTDTGAAVDGAVNNVGEAMAGI